MSENLVLDFYHEELSCNAYILMPYCSKSPLWKRPTKLCKKNLEIIQNTFFMDLDGKNNTFGQIKVLVCSNTIEHTKTFSGKMFYYFSSGYMKNVFSIISRFFLQTLVGLVNKGDFVQ